MLVLDERDLDYPLDGDGCPTATGTQFLVAPGAIKVVKLEPELGRGFRCWVTLAGHPEPIPVCQVEDAIEAAGG
jgi:hypothetical protein